MKKASLENDNKTAKGVSVGSFDVFDTAKIMIRMNKKERERIEHSQHKGTNNVHDNKSISSRDGYQKKLDDNSSNDEHCKVTMILPKLSRYALRSKVQSTSMTNNAISKRCIKKLN